MFEKTSAILRKACRKSVDIWTQKKGKLDTSHRYDLLPLLRSSPGGIQRELVVYDFPDAKVVNFCNSANIFFYKVDKSFKGIVV